MTDPSILQVFVFRDGEYVGSELFTEPEVMVGGGGDVHLFLEDPSVAPNHAILTHDGGRATVLDLGAPGGVLVNRAPIQHSYVTPRDEIRIGAFTLKIKFATQRKSLRPSAAPRPVSEPPTPAFAEDLHTEILDPPVAQPKAAALIDRTHGARRAAQRHVPTALVRDREAEQEIDHIIQNELSSNLDNITGSIAISNSNIVEAKPYEEQETVAFDARPQTMPPRHRRAERAEAPPTQRPDTTPDPVAAVPELARAREPEPRSDTPKVAPPTPSRRPAAPPSGPIPAGVDFVDEDDDDRDDVERPGFSLVEKLVESNPASLRPGPLALEIIAFAGDEVRHATLLEETGSKYVLGKGHAPTASHEGLKLARLNGEREAIVEFPSDTEGAFIEGGRRVDLDRVKIPQNAVSKRGAVFQTKLVAGSTATLRIGDHGFHLRFVERPKLAAPPDKMKVDKRVSGALGLSLVVHLMAGIVVGLAAPGVVYSEVPRETWAELEQDDLRDVEIKEPEPEPEPEPEEPVVEDDAPEPEPEPKRVKPKRRRRGVTKGVSRKEVKKAGVLGAMGKLNLKAPGRKSMVQAVSNIDAVRAPGGSNYRVGALVGKTPSSKVSVGGGGGGKMLTRGSAALLKGGKGFARIGKRSGTKIRGRVAKAKRSRLKARGTISREEVLKVINKHLKEIQYCYEKTLLKDPGLKGKLTVEWTIKTSGSVGRVKQKTSTLKNPRVASCIMSSIKRWRFPKPRGGLVVVSYPFVFSSVGY